LSVIDSREQKRKYSNSVHQLFHDTFKNYQVLLFYLVPAFLYCLYNNLAFINLAIFDPTTYYLLLQFRVVVTAVIFQILFKKHLSKKQWLSLILLTCGCIIKQLKVSHPETPVIESSDAQMPSFLKLHLSYNLVLILVQVFCSCFAGVYNEYLLKDTGAHVHLMIQNIFMYFDSILCNFLVLVFKGEVMNVFNVDMVSSILQPLVILVIFNGTGCGIITSVFLKNLNSILKNFASALELAFTAVLCWVIFGIAIDIFTILSIAIVSYATFMYSQNPVVNTVRADTKDENQENCV
ncbi:CMP-sialic acid transporter 1-like, partial [Limulus polyphemus]|uniref:CMP-sialic acid transporter 1-like n=1 Tax=Limulus polyphemus TaxID=6850 RepID=A0ABM1TNA9_LIMPO